MCLPQIWTFKAVLRIGIWFQRAYGNRYHQWWWIFHIRCSKIIHKRSKFTKWNRIKCKSNPCFLLSWMLFRRIIVKTTQRVRKSGIWKSIKTIWKATRMIHLIKYILTVCQWGLVLLLCRLLFFMFYFIRLTKDVKILYIYFIHNLIFVSLFWVMATAKVKYIR